MSNLETWFIQNYPDELMSALSLIEKNSKNNVLFTNCESSFVLGGIHINSIKFDTILLSEESKILILLMKNGVVNKDDITKYLNNNGISYNEVVFCKKYENEDNEKNYYNEIPELWFCTSSIELENALNHTKIKLNSNNCIYYPNISGHFSMKYISKDDEKINMLKFKNNSVITTCDKAILLYKSLSQEDIIETINKMNFIYYISEYSKPKFVNKEFIKNKRLQKKQYKVLKLKANHFKK